MKVECRRKVEADEGNLRVFRCGDGLYSCRTRCSTLERKDSRKNVPSYRGKGKRSRRNQQRKPRRTCQPYRKKTEQT